MKEEFQHPVERGSVSPEEIIKSQNYDKDLVASEIQERINTLRSDIFSKFLEFGIIDDTDKTWALYEADEVFEDDDMDVFPVKGTLVLLIPCEGDAEVDGHSVPNIRIITNELCVSEENKMQYLSFDFTLDSDGGANYCVDATDSTDLADSHSPIFSINDGELYFSYNSTLFTPVMHIKGQIKGRKNGAIDLLPFGRPNSPTDHLYALEIGQTLFDEIKQAQPTYCSNPNN